MARELKTIIGDIDCPVCGMACVVKAERGDSAQTLSYKCSYNCDNPGYAIKGTKAHEIILSKTRLRKPAPPEKPEPIPAAVKPAEKKAADFC